MATAKKKTSAGAKNQKGTSKKSVKAPAKKAAAPKKAVEKKVSAPKKEVAAADASGNPSLEGLDRKSLAGRARQLKLELMAIRFNLQTPNLKDYRRKRRELATLLAQLG